MTTIELVAKEYFNKEINEISIRRCKTGDVNTSYIASCDSKKVFIKIQDKTNLPAFYSGQIEREVAGLEICKNNGIQCPKILLYDYKRKFIVTEYIEYPLLGQLWSSINTTQKLNIKQLALGITRKMNSVMSHMFGAIFHSRGENFSNWGDCYYHLIKTAIDDCLFYKTLTKEDSYIILKVAQENTTFLYNDIAAHFCHMDFHWNNIFVRQKDDTYEVAGVIDFGSSLFTPAYMDLFRLEGGFLYGTERFYENGIRPYEIDKHQLFCADLLNTIDYFVFLSFTHQSTGNLKIRLIDICKKYSCL